ncbi:hypothetical protein PDESU_00848 [Pontiella desulfatans]|uniref:SHOCT domain-containing protein n=1 Tax=Pontiella desulfatans TaxID=2750659 RepID=A0A6C2TXI7_PONDE|nr:DUF4870 domain-containing protein [Pontiella desulfatans]VGO12297.1 hypothetical protein PDESU_00848 [Pontiella desulfatans]
MNLIEELEKLEALHRNGALSDAEFREAKHALLTQHQGFAQSPSRGMASSDDELWGVLLHLSQFGGYLIPLGGWIIPIVLWLIKRNDSPVIDRHGRIVINWILTEIIYGIIFALLSIFVIGIPLLIILGILAFVYPIIGAVKASGGKTWDYPGNIHFL